MGKISKVQTRNPSTQPHRYSRYIVSHTSTVGQQPTRIKHDRKTMFDDSGPGLVVTIPRHAD